MHIKKVMINSNRREPISMNGSRPLSKSKLEQQAKQLRILDYRNGKYQGFTSQNSLEKDGLGT